MSTPIHIKDGSGGTGSKTKVTKAGQLIVAPFGYDETVFNELNATAATAFHFFPPKAGKQFVVTGIIASANKDVSNTVTATIIVFEGDSTTDATADKVLLEFVLVRFGVLAAPPLNILVSEGKFINATTSDASVFMTIMGYYIPTLN